jgi:hypothetical protein
MNATLAVSKVDAQFVGMLVFRMPTIAKNAYKWKKTVMVVRKLSTLGQQKRTFGMSGRSTALRNGEAHLK